MKAIIAKLSVVFTLLTPALSEASAVRAAGGVGETVIAHYAKQGDSLKLKAARFLTENMARHSYYDSPLLRRYYSAAEGIGRERDYRKRINKFRELYAELGDIGAGRQTVADADGMGADVLIAGIDSAFADWRCGHWARHLSFGEFCEWLLPYRVADERPERWRGRLSALYRHYAEALDSCDERSRSAYWAARAVASGLAASGYRMDDKALPHTDIDLPVSTMMAMGMGECGNYARLAVFVMRACGIPAALDFTPQWPNKAHRHTWNVLLAENGRHIPFLGGDVLPGTTQRSADRLAKVYRRTFAYRPESAAALNERFHDPLPPTLASPFMADVSDEYFRGGTVSITLPESVLKRRMAYLAVFDNAEWVPVCHAVIDSLRHVTFTSLGRDIVYMPVYWGRAGSVPCGNPVLVRADGGTATLAPDSSRTLTLTISRKYPVAGRVYDFARSLRGGVHRGLRHGVEQGRRARCRHNGRALRVVEHRQPQQRRPPPLLARRRAGKLTLRHRRTGVHRRRRQASRPHRHTLRRPAPRPQETERGFRRFSAHLLHQLPLPQGVDRSRLRPPRGAERAALHAPQRRQPRDDRPHIPALLLRERPRAGFTNSDSPRGLPDFRGRAHRGAVHSTRPHCGHGGTRLHR